MKKGVIPVFLAITAVLLYWGCAHGTGTVTTPHMDGTPVFSDQGDHASQWQSEWQYQFGEPCDPIPLIAGQYINVGQVVVTHDETNVYVLYETIDGWYMTETHLHIARTVEDIPQANGNPIPGLFDYSMIHNPPVQVYEYTVPICSFLGGGWSDGDEFVITAHAVVQKQITENGLWIETAWAGDSDCYDFSGANWAKYCICTIQCKLVNCLVEIPASPVIADFHVLNKCKFNPPEVWGFWEEVDLSNVPSGYSVYNGTFAGWCLERSKEIDNQLHVPPQPEFYSVNLFSSQASNLPGSAAYCDWERINYILNHKHPAASKCDIQQAIWYFTVPPFTDLDPLAQEMVDDAQANGGGYHPGSDWTEIEAVILDAGPDYQMTFIEAGCIPVEQPCDEPCPITPPPPPPPPLPGCETAYAYGGEYATCFIDCPEIIPENWGWTNGPLPEGHYVFDLWAGAGQCNLANGTNVGTLTIDYFAGTASIEYELSGINPNTLSLYTLNQAHLFVGNERFPLGPNGEYTSAPGQYPYSTGYLPGGTTSYLFTIEGLNGLIYVIAQAEVCGFPVNLAEGIP